MPTTRSERHLPETWRRRCDGRGKACVYDEECVEGLFCGGGTCTDEVGSGERCYDHDGDEEMPSACAPPLEEGDACYDDDGCADGLSCATGEAGATCAPLPGIDEPCAGPCVDGDWCYEGTCHPLGGEGDPCDPFLSGGCAEGYFCAWADSSSDRLRENASSDQPAHSRPAMVG